MFTEVESKDWRCCYNCRSTMGQLGTAECHGGSFGLLFVWRPSSRGLGGDIQLLWLLEMYCILHALIEKNIK